MPPGGGPVPNTAARDISSGMDEVDPATRLAMKKGDNPLGLLQPPKDAPAVVEKAGALNYEALEPGLTHGHFPLLLVDEDSFKQVEDYLCRDWLPNTRIEVLHDVLFPPPGYPSGSPATYLLRVHEYGKREMSDLCSALHKCGTGHGQLGNFSTHPLYCFQNFVVMKEKLNSNQWGKYPATVLEAW